MSDSVKLQLVSPGDDKPTEGTALGTLQVSFTPATNKTSSDLVEERIKTQKALPVSLEATGMSVRNELIATLVSSNGEDEERHVAILNKHLGVCRVFLDVHLRNPGYVIMSPEGGSVFVSEEHRVIKINLEGVVEAIAGNSEPGNAPMNFYTPSGMAFHPVSNQLYIADHSNNRIQVLNNDLSFSFLFPSTPLPAKDTSCPTDLAFDCHGILYISDDANNCILKYAANGQYISMFSSFGSDPGLLNEPMYLAIDSNCLVYVCEIDGDRISVFSTNGYFKFVLKTHERMCVTGFDVDSRGDLYLCDYSQKNITII